MKTGRPELISEINKKLILDYLKKNGPQSRADLKRSMGLSFPAVSANVKDLIDKKLICETGISDNAIGRKATLIQYNSQYGYILGIDIGRSSLRMMIADLLGNPVCFTKSDKVTEKKAQDLLAQIDEEIEKIIGKAKISKSDLMAISIGIPGIVDYAAGKHRLEPFMEGFKEIRLDLYIKEKYKIHTIVCNSVDFGGIGEKWKGAAQNYRNVVYIDYGVGIGCSLILNGQLYSGANYAAGEVGYMLPGINYQRKAYEEEGVLEKLIAGLELERMISGKDSKLKSVREVFERESEYNFFYERLIEDIKNLVGLMLVNMVSIINPEVIIMAGGIGKQLALKYADYFKEFLSAHIPYVPEILPSVLDEKASLYGAISVALKEIDDNLLG